MTGQQSLVEGALVEVLDGTQVKQRFLLQQGSLRIGSAPPCELILQDRTVSRHHATLAIHARGVRITDHQSRNGSWYLGARLTDAVVGLGSTVRFGRTFVRLVTNAPPEVETDGLAYQSQAMKRLIWSIQKAAESGGSTLLVGETGVGKEALARLLHAKSSVSAGPVVVVDCPSLSGDLSDSDLFGHAKGAFTGAHAARVGAIESATSGTLILDNVGEMPMSLQPKLLRLLEQKTFSRLGENVTRAANFRLISTTHHDLEARARQGLFRQDLFYRLAVIVLHVLPLSERPEDIRPLARFFAKERGYQLTEQQLKRLEANHYPGNVRQLRNEVERLSAGLELPAAEIQSTRSPLRGSIESKYLTALLDRHQGNVTKAAIEAGLSRSQIHRLLQKHGMVGFGKTKRK
jgi:DNA-binding NtrC family response regulator